MVVYVRGWPSMRSIFWRLVMGLLFVLIIFLDGGPMPGISLWSHSELVLTFFVLRLIIILIEGNISVSYVLWMSLRQRLTLSFIVLSFMRSEGDFIVCSKIVSLFHLFSITVSSGVSRFIFRRPLCSAIVLYSHFFLFDIPLISLLLPFSQPYLLYRVWKGRPILPVIPAHNSFLCQRQSSRISQRQIKVMSIHKLILLWLISFLHLRAPSLCLGPSLCLSSPLLASCCLLF